LNARWISQGYALHRVRTFLRQLQPQDHLGIYVLGNNLKVVYDVTRDASGVVEAVHRYDKRHVPGAAKPTAREVESSGDPLLDRFLAGKDNRDPFELDGHATPAYRRAKLEAAGQMTTASLEAIARELSGVPGRKTLVWITDGVASLHYLELSDLDTYLASWSGRSGHGLPYVPTWVNGHDVEEMVRLMNDAGVAVYTVDARGLETEDLGWKGAGPRACPPTPGS